MLMIDLLSKRKVLLTVDGDRMQKKVIGEYSIYTFHSTTGPEHEH